MTDLSHQWGADLAVGPTGDLATADGSLLGQQRVLRRLLTNPGDYIWQLDYGAGLGRFIGKPVNAGQIQAAIRSQIFKETAVARTPEPTINVSLGPAGVVAVDIRYVDATSGQTQILSFTVGG
jgi:phage baseplate assembly protein W